MDEEYQILNEEKRMSNGDWNMGNPKKHANSSGQQLVWVYTR
jgi:hypothetical protein